jgi:diguanylate cyclase (GGDEF)-like protein
VAEGLYPTHGDLAIEDSAEAARGLELTQLICGRLREVDLHGGAIDGALRDLKASYGHDVYSELLHVLCNLRFDSAEAEHRWNEILEHRETMERRLGGPLDLRVALFSYFVDVQRRLDNPKIIELADFERARESAYTDELTGLRNYRFFAEQLNHEVLRTDQYDEPLSLVMLDLDHFKEFNDRNGHEAGNEVLRRVGRIIRDTLRNVDVGARYGGEEFAIILPSTPKVGAQPAAERLRAAIEAEEFPGKTGEHPALLTASFGVATYPADARTAKELVEHADRALYAAKSDGRNRVSVLGGLRSFPRVYVGLDGRCRVDGVERPLRTIQLGMGGVSFRTTTRLDPGALVEVELALPERASPLAVSGRVLRVTPGGDGWIEAALRFIDIPRAERKVVSALVRNSPERRAPRS